MTDECRIVSHADSHNVAPLGVTGQVQFDSHVLSLLAVTVDLVNRLTPGYDGGAPVDTPTGRARVNDVAASLAQGGAAPKVTLSAADKLTEAALHARAVFDATAAGDVDRAAARVNRLLRETQTRPQLDRFSAGWSLHFHGANDSLATGWAAGCAAALALAIGSDLAGRLGVCAAPKCDRVYVDTSKNGRRRFCSPRCQSRVKAAAHRSRAAGAAAPPSSSPT